MKLNYKLSTILGLPMILAACAGGGDIKEPEVFVSLPTATAVDVNASNVKSTNNSAVHSMATNGGELKQYAINREIFTNYFSDDEVFLYKTPDGKHYELTKFSNVITSDSGSESKAFPTKHYMQPTDNGGKIIACCKALSTTYSHATHLDNSYYGAWVDASGNTSFFSGGILADTENMQGGSNSLGKGKATYDVLAIRVKNGQAVSSSYTPTDEHSKLKEKSVISQLTVNFNTGKLGGEIIGNSDFGDSIIMKDVSVSGNTFSGSATSGSATGAVQGAFYEPTSEPTTTDSHRRHSGSEIGGIVKFSDTSLNAAFGGERSAIDSQSQSTDLTPLTNSE